MVTAGLGCPGSKFAARTAILVTNPDCELLSSFLAAYIY